MPSSPRWEQKRERGKCKYWFSYKRRELELLFFLLSAHT
jgi:hypothetical protein